MNFEDIAEKESILISEILKEDQKQGYFVGKGLINGKDTLIKITLTSFKLKAKNIEKEYLVDLAMKEYNAHSDSQVFRLPAILFRKNTQYVLYAREYLPGEPLSGSTDDSQTLFGCDQIQPKYLSARDTIIPQVFQEVMILQKISLDQSLLAKPRFSLQPSEYSLLLESELGIDLKKVVGFFERGKADYSSLNHQVVCMYDLNPPNILITANQKACLFDFEWLSVDNYMTDIVFFWLFLWPYSDWQTAWLEQTVKTDQDKEFFRLGLIRQVLDWYGKTFDPNRNLAPSLEKRRQELKSHIWVRYLLAAGESYEAILNIKE